MPLLDLENYLPMVCLSNFYSLFYIEGASPIQEIIDANIVPKLIELIGSDKPYLQVYSFLFSLIILSILVRSSLVFDKYSDRNCRTNTMLN